MGSIFVVENCGMCPECWFNENHTLEKFGEHYCIVTGHDIKLNTMPDDFPLPVNTGRDYEAEIARLKRQLMQYRTLYSSHHGKFWTVYN